MYLVRAARAEVMCDEDCVDSAFPPSSRLAQRNRPSCTVNPSRAENPPTLQWTGSHHASSGRRGIESPRRDSLEINASNPEMIDDT